MGRIIDKYEDYIVYENGTIFSKKRNIFLKQICIQGYLYVNLHNKYGKKRFSIHKLVANAFLKNKDLLKTDINHKNGKKSDNCVSNLEWVTKSENNKHAYHTGLRTKALLSISKVVLNTQNGVFYNSIREAAESINMDYQSLTHRLAGRLKNKTNLILA
jgi:hypothetical protein